MQQNRKSNGNSRIAGKYGKELSRWQKCTNVHPRWGSVGTLGNMQKLGGRGGVGGRRD